MPNQPRVLKEYDAPEGISITVFEGGRVTVEGANLINATFYYQSGDVRKEAQIRTKIDGSRVSYSLHAGDKSCGGGGISFG